jgi:WD40 repeat protein
MATFSSPALLTRPSRSGALTSVIATGMIPPPPPAPLPPPPALCRSLLAHEDTVTCVRFQPETHYFFSSSKDGSVKYWDADRSVPPFPPSSSPHPPPPLADSSRFFISRTTSPPCGQLLCRQTDPMQSVLDKIAPSGSGRGLRTWSSSRRRGESPSLLLYLTATQRASLGGQDRAGHGEARPTRCHQRLHR